MVGDWQTAPMRVVHARWDDLEARWGLDGEERSALLGSGTGPVDRVETYLAPSTERRMRLLVALEPAVAAVLVDDGRIRSWLRRPNANLRGSTPLEVMAESPEWIRWLIEALGVAS